MYCSQQSRDFSNTNPSSVDIHCCEEKNEDSGMHDAQRTSRKQQPTLTPRTKIPTYTPAANNDPSCSVSRCQPSAVCMPTTRLQTALCQGKRAGECGVPRGPATTSAAHHRKSQKRKARERSNGRLPRYITASCFYKAAASLAVRQARGCQLELAPINGITARPLYSRDTGGQGHQELCLHATGTRR